MNYGITSSDIKRFTVLRNTVHGDSIQIDESDIDLLMNFSQLLICTIMAKAKCTTSEIFNSIKSI